MSGGLDLSKLTPEMLAQTPAGVAPDGIYNLVDPPTVGYHVLVANSVLMFGMFVFAGLRFFVALRVRGRFAADDWVTVAAIVGACYYYITVCLAIVHLRFGTHLWDLSIAHMRSRDMAIIGFMSNGPPNLIWPVIKSIFFMMYLNLFRPLIWMRRCVYFGLTIVWLWYVASGIAQIIITTPPPGKGWVESFATPRYLQTFKLTVPTSTFALVSDLYILILPLVAISHLKLSTNKKMGVAAMFSTGLMCCCASSVTLYFQHRIWRNQSDYTYYVVFVYLGYTIEMCVGICTACMPSLARLHKDRIAPHSSSAYSSSRKDTIESHDLKYYSRRSQYRPMGEDTGRNSASHELARMTSHIDATDGHSHLGSDAGLTYPQSSHEPKRAPWH